jgi:SAM-dependent methyltransferase
VLEIGCGTGQATLPLARRGYLVTALEPGPAMAAIAARKLASHRQAQIVVSRFEDWPLPAAPFDAVVSASAFHWIDPAIRVMKSADALRSGATFARISTEHIAGGDSAFFAEAQDCYRRWYPGSTGIELPRAHGVPQDLGEFVNSGRLGRIAVRSYEWEQTYSASGFVDLLDTYSDNRILSPEVRQRLFDCLASLIEKRYGGRIRKRYLNQLLTARRL